MRMFRNLGRTEAEKMVEEVLVGIREQLETGATEGQSMDFIQTQTPATEN